MRNYFYLFLLSVIYVLFWIYDVSNISISYKEAWIYFYDDSFLHYLINFATSIFGVNDYAVRLFFLIFHIANIFLIYEVGKYFVKRDYDALFSAFIYTLLPGVNVGAVLVNSVTVVVFVTLLFLFFYLKGFKKISYFLLFISLFIDNSFFILYISLIVYGYFIKDKILIFINSVLFLISFIIYGFDFAGKPFGYFLDIFGAYALIFSPFLFIYFFYAMYRILIKEKKNILWFISFTSLVLSLLFSFRQKIHIEDYAAFVVIGTPLMVWIFFASYRIRLKEFRKMHRFVFWVVMVFLIFNFLLLHFNKFLFLILDNPNKHFAKKFYFAKELANSLKNMEIEKIRCEDRRLCLRLKFYGIKEGGKFLVSTKPKDKIFKKVSIRYMNRDVKNYYVSKINT